MITINKSGKITKFIDVGFGPEVEISFVLKPSAEAKAWGFANKKVCGFIPKEDASILTALWYLMTL